MSALFFGSNVLAFGGRALLFGSTAIATTLPVQGGWGTYDTREDERRQARVAKEASEDAARRKRAVERAFRALDVQPELVPEALAPAVKAEIRAVALPNIDLSGVGAAIDRAGMALDALIEQMWAERRALAEEAALKLRLRQEEEALIALLMVA